MGSVSVVICAYTEDRWIFLLKAIESLKSQTVPPNEIILVIDHNNALLQQVKTHIPDVVVIKNSEAPGLSGARNCGISASRYEIIAFLDDDACAVPDWLEQLCTCYDQANVMGVGGKIDPLWPEERPGWFPAEFDWVVGCTHNGMPHKITPVRNLIGANMSFKREIFDVTGGFRSEMGRVQSYPAGCEETELCIRAGQQWPYKKLLYNPKARVIHHVPLNRANLRYFSSRCYTEGLSKAKVSRLVGVGDGLASERTYCFRTLPKGVMRGFSETFLKGNPKGLMRASAMVFGLIFTTLGYVIGTIREHRSSPKQELYS
jgi:GT2 family glycosyltransferase